MENRYEHNSQEEQGWGAYVAPPVYGSQQMNLCANVRNLLPDLLENDGSVRPEMATAIYGHLTVCPGCAREYDEMQRVIARLEALPMADMPMDYSGVIMRRIQAQAETFQRLQSTDASPPMTAVANHQAEQAVVTQQVKQTSLTQTQAVNLAQSVTQTQAQTVQRLTLGGLLSGVLAFFLSTAWGRQMLGVNASVAGAWLEQITDMMSRVPILGWIVGLIASVLAQSGSLLSETYHSLGSLAARGLAIDIAMCALAYYYVLSRRQRERRLGA